MQMLLFQLDYLETRLEEHFQIINAIAIAIQDNASGELKQNKKPRPLVSLKFN